MDGKSVNIGLIRTKIYVFHFCTTFFNFQMRDANRLNIFIFFFVAVTV